jgi:DNA gyrase subunit A
MKLEDDDGILGVETCSPSDDVLLSTAQGQAIRFRVDDVRVFAGRNSVGVRGINLAKDDAIISMTVLRHFDATPEERTAYLKMSRALRGETEESNDLELEAEAGSLDQDRYAAMSAAEQFVLAISGHGYGKRSSSFEYRVTGRGGKGITGMAITAKNGPVVASFPVENDDQIMLVTDGGKLIRVPVEGIRLAGRATQGVIVFHTAEDEKVVSVERISEPEDDEIEDEEGVEGQVGEGDSSSDDGDAAAPDNPED